MRVNRRGDSIYYHGTLQNPRIFLFIGRNNFLKDDLTLYALMQAFAMQGSDLILYENAITTIRRLMDPEGKHESLQPRFRKITNALTLLKHPSRWRFFLPWHKAKIESLSYQCESLKDFITTFKEESKITILSRSAGGLISSLVADEMKISKLVCLGYPFHHPEKQEELERYEHLKGIQTPFLIIQGRKDKYGGEEILEKYRLSPKIKIEFANTDHDFVLAPQDWNQILKKIFDFIQN